MDEEKKAEKQKQEKVKKVRMQFAALRQRILVLTPADKPLIVYNLLQNKFLAFTTFDKLSSQSAEKLEIETNGGEKVLVNRTCSTTMTRYQEDEYIMRFIIAKIMASPYPFSEESNRVFGEGDGLQSEYYDLCKLAQDRIFRFCEELYIQMGTKAPEGHTRADIERLNTRCYDPSEVWEALKADINQSIQTRTQAG